jgi:hypothetical protein
MAKKRQPIDDMIDAHVWDAAACQNDRWQP